MFNDPQDIAESIQHRFLLFYRIEGLLGNLAAPLCSYQAL
jgi:hypothetical protein